MSWLLVLPNETLASALAERVDESDAILAVMNDRNERAQLSFGPRPPMSTSREYRAELETGSSTMICKRCEGQMLPYRRGPHPWKSDSEIERLECEDCQAQHARTVPRAK